MGVVRFGSWSRRRTMALGLWMALLAALLLERGPLASAADLDQDSHAGPLAVQPCGQRSASAPAHYRHVIWIWMENHSYHQVIGSEDAPFENRLARACGLATSYRAITHPTLPNYLAATGGSTFGVSHDQFPSLEPINAPTTTPAINSEESRKPSAIADALAAPFPLPAPSWSVSTLRLPRISDNR